MIPREVSGSTNGMRFTEGLLAGVGRIIDLDDDYSAQHIAIEIVKRSGVIDTNDQNTSSIAALDLKVDEKCLIPDGFQDFVVESELIAVDGVPLVGQFRSEIINRANIPDLTADLRPRMGIERIMIQQIERLQDEVGPSGELVFRVTNDDNDQIRFIGGGWTSANDVNGSAALLGGGTSEELIEVTFVGTGLNMLENNGTGRDLFVKIDGGAEGITSILQDTSTILSTRNYATNVVYNAAEGLAFGLHTIRFRKDNTGWGQRVPVVRL